MHTLYSGSSAGQAVDSVCEDVPRLDDDTLRQLLADARLGSTDELRLPLTSDTQGFAIL